TQVKSKSELSAGRKCIALTIYDTAEEVDRSAKEGRVSGKGAGREKGPRDERTVIGQTCLVPRRGEVCHALGHHGVDRLGDDAVLEHRRVQYSDIVHDDAGARGG